MHKSFDIILAADEGHGIGKNNELPWKIPEDLKYFAQMTKNKSVIMGRKTFESIGKPLPNRENIVLSRNSYKTEQGVIVSASFEEALAVASLEIIVIGGAEIYKIATAFEGCNKIYITKIKGKFDCDVFFHVPKKFLCIYETIWLNSVSGNKFCFSIYEKSNQKKEQFATISKGTRTKRLNSGDLKR